jgi:methyl-accepting chemotaxis protein
MYGETEVMRKHADRLREQARDIRSIAERIVAQADGVTWAGRAGEDLRERVRERAARLREAADRHEYAADSLGSHIQTVDGLKDAIAESERRVTALLDDAALPPFDPPPPGHKDWLAVTLPEDPGSGDRARA